MNNKEELLTEEELLGIFNLTDDELDNRIKEEMRKQGHKKFINYQGEEEDL